MRVAKRLERLLAGHGHRDKARRFMERSGRAQVLDWADNEASNLISALRDLEIGTAPEALEKGTEALVVLVAAFETLARRS